MHVKKGDKVIVIAGANKGATGSVLKVFSKENKVVVDGVNKVKRHQRGKKGAAKGQIVEKMMPLHASNVRKEK